MKITEYPKTSTLANDDVFILDNPNPTGGGREG